MTPDEALVWVRDCLPACRPIPSEVVEALAADVRRLRDERDMLEAWVRRTADSPELRSKHAGYHARRVNLEAGKLLCRLVEMRDAAPEPQEGGE